MILDFKELKDFFTSWLENFPYPTMVIDGSLHVILANRYAVMQVPFIENGNSNIVDSIDQFEEEEFRHFINSVKDTQYVQKTMNLSGMGLSNVIGRKINKEDDYYLILIVPDSLKEKYLLLQKQYSAVADHISDSVILTDANQKIVETNRAFSKITGYDFEEVVGRFPSILQSGKHDHDFYKKMFLEIEEKGYFKGPITDRRKSGEEMEGELTIVPIEDTFNKIINYIGIFHDITEVSKLRSNLLSSKNRDPLTKVQNRESFLHILDVKCELATPKNSLALLFIDLNKFKQVNDTYGHRYGDFVLLSAAKRMKKALRDNDLIGRYGGDEFLVLLERVDEKSAYGVAKKIQEALSSPYVIDEQVIDFVSGSFGIAFAPTDAKNAVELIEKADQAMYKAKKDLSGEHIMHSSDLSEYEDSKTLKAELLQAIDNDEFYIKIQPIVNIVNNKIVGGEVLSRWLNLNFNEVYPSTFIPMLETLGINKKFDINILNKTIELLESLLEEPTDTFFIDVNFSAEQFNDDNFLILLEDILEVKPWVKEYIVIEITESTMMLDIEKTTHHLKVIKELGFKIAIDDFGTGFSSMAYLRHFSIDYIKIDKSFIDNLEENEKDVKIVKAIITLANAIDAKTIVEGVERQTQFDIIKNLGADYIQGYYYYKPMLPHLFFKKLLKN